VDSERDTPEQLKLYLSSFDPHIRGLTGSEGQIQQATKAYRVYYKRVAQDGGGYTYDHSAVIYLMDKDGRYVGVLTFKEPDASALSKLRDLLAGRHS
jgi:protein SCO1/2